MKNQTHCFHFRKLESSKTNVIGGTQVRNDSGQWENLEMKGMFFRILNVLVRKYEMRMRMEIRSGSENGKWEMGNVGWSGKLELEDLVEGMEGGKGSIKRLTLQFWKVSLLKR